MTDSRPIVIGGGITGLACAYEFVKHDVKPILIEPRPHLGGVIETEVIDGCVLEGGPDSFLAAKPAAANLIRELGLGDDLIGSNDADRITYLVKGGKLIPMPDGLMMMVPTRILPVAASSLLSWSTKIRMGLEYFRKPPQPPSGDRSVADFIRDHYGQETVDYLADPLLTGVYGGSSEYLSVESVLPRFAEIERKYGSLTRGVLAARKAMGKHREAGPLFQTLKGGLAQLVRALEERIRPSTEVLQGAASSVERTASGYSVTAGASRIETSRLVLAVPAWAAGNLLQGIDPGISRLLSGIDYSSSITLALGYRKGDCGRIPPGFGFLVPARERKTLVACTFVGAKFSHRVPEDQVVLRCFLGGAGQEAILDASDEEVVSAVRRELKELLGWDVPPHFVRLRRWRRSMAQYGVGHNKLIRAVHDRLEVLPGLQLAGNAYDGIGISDCIRTGRQAAKTLLLR